VTAKQLLKQYLPSPVLQLHQKYHRWKYQQTLRKKEPFFFSPLVGKAHGGNFTALFICGPHFDQRVPNSMTKFRIGLMNGFEEEGIRCEFISFTGLNRLSEFANPIVFCQECDYEFLGLQQIRLLRPHKKFIWVDPWREDIQPYLDRFEFPGMSLSEKTKKKVLDSEPSFAFTIAPVSGLQHYARWERLGIKLVSLPLACDTALYDRFPPSPAYQNVKIAFVGGYWPYKAKSFDRYLKPYENQLTVFGYWAWPYAGYGGELKDEEEPCLYSSALLCPAINEPHVPVMDIDINERVFKVLGSGGLCVTDVTRGYRELFKPDELLVPESIDEYHSMVRAALEAPESLRDYRERGYRAVRERHTYRHRARAVLQTLGLTPSGQ
jgi:hypothetical protein